MSWMLGVGLGLLRGGPLGAIVGGVVQHFITKKFQKSLKRNLSAVQDEAGFVTCLVASLSYVCMGRGSISPGQARVIHKFFARNLNYDGEGLKYINEIIRQSKRINPDVSYLAENYKKATGGNYILLLLALAYQTSLVDGALVNQVQDRINALANGLEVDPAEHNRVRAKYSLEALKTPYHILEISSSASDDEIRKAYRLKASEFHPDRVAHLGQDQVEMAHLMFLEVQAAYRELERIRGF